MASQANSIKWKQLDEYIRSLVSQASVTANSAEIASQIASQLSAYLRKAGGTMTGHIVLVGDPTASLHPVSLQYFNANIPAAGVFTYVDTVEVTGSPATTMTLSGLNLASDEEYVVRYVLASNTASTATVSLHFNGDTTPGNYRRESANRFTAGGGSDHGYISEMRGSGDTVGLIHTIRDDAGYPRSLSDVNSGGITDIFGSRIVHVWQDTSNVTSASLTASVSSAFAVGSYADFFKRVAA